jgi:hypothetical protein
MFAVLLGVVGGDLEEGPTLPGQALIHKAKANLGGFMLPGERDRWVVYAK